MFVGLSNLRHRDTAAAKSLLITSFLSETKYFAETQTLSAAALVNVLGSLPRPFSGFQRARRVSREPAALSN